MRPSKNYLSRYLHDVGEFLLAFIMAAFGIFPMIAITYQMYLPFVYLFVAFIGVPLILLSPRCLLFLKVTATNFSYSY